MRTTIKIIAEKAGVSIGTVDRVLHQRPYVKAEVRERVLRVMEELDYHPNRMASALATSGTPRRLALIQPEWDDDVRGEMEAGVARFLEEYRDYNVSLDCRTYSREDEGTECLRLLNEAVENGARAIALCASGTEEIRRGLERLAEQGVLTATFNSDVPGGKRLCYVGEDGHRAGRVAGEIAARFLRPGELCLVVYAGPAYSAHKARVDGFLERLAERGFSREDCLVAATHKDYAKTRQAVSQALEGPRAPKVIYMANPSVSACADAIREKGMTGQVHVLSHDSGPEIRALLQSGEVDFTIDQDLAYQPCQALRVLFGALMGRKPERDCYDTACPILNAETI